MNFQGKHDVGELSPSMMSRFMLVICQAQPTLLSTHFCGNQCDFDGIDTV